MTYALESVSLPPEAFQAFPASDHMLRVILGVCKQSCMISEFSVLRKPPSCTHCLLSTYAVLASGED